jgi:hypothetical protein|tara:strand:+ start:1491 stop:2483 length:993 start_codon:yes stop_codon:yes gene_type:complete
MINSVRNTVLAIINKNNYGYLSPNDFNLFAKQAQLDLFDEYFFQYNQQINEENARLSGTGYADIKKGYEEVIDTFSATSSLAQTYTTSTTVAPSGLGNVYTMPSTATTGFDYYLLNKVLIYSTVTATGTNTAVAGASAGNELIDAAATFTSALVGKKVAIVLNNNVVTTALITAFNNSTTLTVNTTLITSTGKNYKIYDDANLTAEAELVSNSKITMLNNSLLTTPNLTYPAYTQEANSVSLFPSTVSSMGQVVAQYIRYPKDPKWTFTTISNGDPVFDQSQADYQDFELPIDDANDLVSKILQYAGISIREGDVFKFGQVEEQTQNQEQ